MWEILLLASILVVMTAKVGKALFGKNNKKKKRSKK